MKHNLRCFRCPFGRNCINGRWCERLKLYVEHDERERCEEERE